MGEPYLTTQKLRFCDSDALGHVNNAVYSVMLEAGRAEMVAQTGLLDPKGGFGVVIARLELDFLREMTWPGEVRIESTLVKIGDRTMHMQQTLHQGDTKVARARSVLAVIDINTRRSVPIAQQWRDVLDRWLVPAQD
jgi:acyl-CoA thioester hydrolase